jgi:DNA-directed RNA polymerase specialized sigma24 family protein
MLDMNDPGDTKDPMDSHPEIPTGPHRPAGVFVSTLWSVVLRAGSTSDPESTAALERLCRLYWQPLHAFARRSGFSEHDSQDLTQAFLADLLQRQGLSRVDRNRGRFRNFLLASFRHFLANRRREGRAEKRGGGQFLESLEEMAEGNMHVEGTDAMTPELQYERVWAMSLLDRILDRLRGEYAASGREALFEALQPFLAAAGGHHGYGELGRKLGMAESTVGVVVHRMRRRYGELLREEITATVESPEEVDDELRHLLRVVSDVQPAN